MKKFEDYEEFKPSERLAKFLDRLQGIKKLAKAEADNIETRDASEVARKIYDLLHELIKTGEEYEESNDDSAINERQCSAKC